MIGENDHNLPIQENEDILTTNAKSEKTTNIPTSKTSNTNSNLKPNNITENIIIESK